VVAERCGICDQEMPLADMRAAFAAGGVALALPRTECPKCKLAAHRLCFDFEQRRFGLVVRMRCRSCGATFKPPSYKP
jgi:hypothetical protein